MRRPEKPDPAAPELLGSMGAVGTERFDRQADDDQEDMSPACFDQSFPARWIARRIARYSALPPHSPVWGLSADISDQNRATGPLGGAE